MSLDKEDPKSALKPTAQTFKPKADWKPNATAKSFVPRMNAKAFVPKTVAAPTTTTSTTATATTTAATTTTTTSENITKDHVTVEPTKSKLNSPVLVAKPSPAAATHEPVVLVVKPSPVAIEKKEVKVEPVAVVATRKTIAEVVKSKSVADSITTSSTGKKIIAPDTTTTPVNSSRFLMPEEEQFESENCDATTEEKEFDVMDRNDLSPLPSKDGGRRITYTFIILLEFKNRCNLCPEALPRSMPTKGYEPQSRSINDDDYVQPELHKSENRWKHTKVSGDAAVIRSVQNILNKLTIEKFDKLSSQFAQLEITSESLMSTIVGLVIDKAIVDHNFSSMYANLCVVLSEAVFPFMNDDGESYNLTFKKVLLNMCHEKFMNRNVFSELPEDSSEEEKEEHLNKMKWQSKGIIYFTGELFNCKLLRASVIHQCIVNLICGDDNVPSPDDDSLDSLCKLISIVGKTLEGIKMGSHIPVYFKWIEILSEDIRVSNRTKFGLRDIIELRECMWVPRREETKAMAIDDLHKAALREEYGGKKNKKPEVVVDEDGWTTIKIDPIKNYHRKKKSEKSAKDKKSSESKKRAKKSAPTHVAEPEASPVIQKSPEKDAVKPLTRAEMKQKTGAIISELLSNEDYGEAVLCTKELKGVDYAATKVINRGFDMVFEKKNKERDIFSKFIRELHRTRTIKSGELDFLIQDILQILDDIAIDVPRVREYMAQILGYLVAKNVLNMKTFETSLAHMVSNNNALSVVGLTLKKFATLSSVDAVHKALNQSGLDMEKLFPKDTYSDELLAAFFDEYEIAN